MNKDRDIFPEETPLIVLVGNSDLCMANNGKDINHTSHIYRRVNFVINGNKCKIHKIYWCGGGLQLADIATKNVGDNYLNNILKYIMVRLDQLIYNTCTIGVTGYRVVYGTIVLYD